MTKTNGKPADKPLSTLPPQDLGAEKALLGSILLDSSCLDDVGRMLQAEDFYLATHQRVYAVAYGLHASSDRVDPITVYDDLLAEKKADGITVELLTGLMESVPHSGGAKAYAAIVCECALRRAVIGAGADAVRDGHDPAIDVEDLAAISSDRILKVLERRAASEQVSLRDVLREAMYSIGEKQAIGLLTGYPDLDNLLNGFQPGNMIVVGARPSMGKTALIGALAMSIARAGHGVGILSLEQSRVELAERLLSAESELSMHRMRKGDLSEDDHDRIMQAAARLDALPIVIDESTGVSIRTVEAIARLMARRHDVRILMVDYLQLIHPEDRRMPREQQVADISRRIKALAKSLNLPIIILAQLNREVEKRTGTDKYPRLSDLRESGSLEQDADVVVFIHRPEFYDQDDRPGIAELIVAKHRNGPKGKVLLRFCKETMAFSELSPEQRSDPQITMPFTDEPNVEKGYF